MSRQLVHLCYSTSQDTVQIFEMNANYAKQGNDNPM